MGACQSSTTASEAAAGATSKPQPKQERSLTAGTSNYSTEQPTMSTTSNGENPKILPHKHSSSIGLDEISEQRKKSGHLVSNVVNIESVRSIEEVYDGVHHGKKLGEGIAGLVRLVTHKATGIPYAVKCLDLNKLVDKVSQEQLRNEITIMSQLDHPNIARLQEVYEDDSQIYLVQELGTGGELFDVLDDQPDYHYSEADAARLVCQMVSSLRYLHSKDIIHRDLKLENFLFSTKRHSQLKMIGTYCLQQEGRDDIE